MNDFIKIPEQRKGVLIGKEGSVKKELEKLTKTKIEVNEDISIEGESLNVIKAKDIIKAIGRGFSPEKAFKLMNEECQLVVISLGSETEKTIKRLMSRVIGRNGLSKRRIEMRTGTDISIYGKTISIIGNWKDVEKAEKAVEMILEGRPHSYVYKFLES
ncbi:MAG: RNA-processing protein [Candidatus Aenigmarchaeota archaeon]|nr:RNA-processing protein [Candidatus Aenigmarchaeota archaeon]NIP40758.1 RNA-processing protein [Candidatus Aenigmarchaeota archaeon]NIQ18564.1 RNA-processing protein [Candidatus Aenigmarchaeota archaeon]NIS73463.1 RNA-processing protein [Candidatus Aenigmarchaeota archaeon]